MSASPWIVVLGLGLPLYAYVAYPVLLFMLAACVQAVRDLSYLVRRTDRRSRSVEWPSVSILIAAYNEEPVIGRTIRSTLAQDYPGDRLEVIIGSDASTDRTVAVAEEYSAQGVRVMAFPRRRGKMAVINDCAARALGDVLVFTDANTVLGPNSVRNLVRHFHDPRVGAVCGEVRLLTPAGSPAAEGAYWHYEVILKILESRLNAVLGANGPIYAVRRQIFPRLRDNLITDDFVIPMKIRARGFRVVYDPEAIAFEEAPSTMSDEFRRRVRIGAGNWQVLCECSSLLLPWKGFVSLAFWSHKVLRWLTPFLLTAAFGANLALLGQPFWAGVFAVQVAFYGSAALGYGLRRLRLPGGPLRLATYFAAINAALALGLLKGVLGMQRPAWQRTAREPLPTKGEQ
jgi:cellulose synthase/poly-beta-1,6-N-acetylglucosamine synthase-like glycosyltransferase